MRIVYLAPKPHSTYEGPLIAPLKQSSEPADPSPKALQPKTANFESLSGRLWLQEVGGSWPSRFGLRAALGLHGLRF